MTQTTGRCASNICVHEYSLKCKDGYFYVKVQISMDIDAFKNLIALDSS